VADTCEYSNAFRHAHYIESYLLFTDLQRFFFLLAYGLFCLLGASPMLWRFDDQVFN
jgi:hypothetical protein